VLSKDGYDVRRLTGGMSEWQHQNMPVVQGKKANLLSYTKGT
jgi:rhodanese-related sulfurtransferase